MPEGIGEGPRNAKRENGDRHVLPLLSGHDQAEIDVVRGCWGLSCLLI